LLRSKTCFLLQFDGDQKFSSEKIIFCPKELKERRNSRGWCMNECHYRSQDGQMEQMQKKTPCISIYTINDYKQDLKRMVMCKLILNEFRKPL
jgi:hypothetical protein